jgi:hypothetical protein
MNKSHKRKQHDPQLYLFDFKKKKSPNMHNLQGNQTNVIKFFNHVTRTQINIKPCPLLDKVIIIYTLAFKL